MFSFLICFSFSKYIAVDFGGFQTKVYNVEPGKTSEISLNLHGKRLTNTFIGFRPSQTYKSKKSKGITGQEEKLLSAVIGEKAIQYSQNKPWYTIGYLPLFIDATEERKKEIGERFRINTTVGNIKTEDLLPMYFQLLAREYAPLEEIDGVTIAVPATFTIPQRIIIADCLEIAGLKCDAVIDDATAIAYNYAIDRTKRFLGSPKNILFVDVGGTSIKAFIYNFQLRTQESDPYLTRLSYVINDNIGGYELTRAIAEYIIKEYKFENVTDAEYKRIEDAAEHLKKKISIVKKSSEIIEDINGEDVVVNLERSVIDKLSKPLVNAVMNVIKEASQRIPYDDIEVVGGSSRVPAVSEAIKNIKEDIVKHSLNSDETIAQGAAYMQQFYHGISIYRSLYASSNYSVHNIFMESDGEEFPFCEKKGGCIPYVEFSIPIDEFSFKYKDEYVLRNLVHTNFTYHINITEEESNISLQFMDTPFDIELIAACIPLTDKQIEEGFEPKCRKVSPTPIGEYYDPSRMYHTVMGKYEREHRITILRHELDSLSSKALREVKFNSTVKTFTNETQRKEVEKRSRAAIQWLSENNDEIEVEHWQEQVSLLKEVVDPIYYRIQENETYFKWLNEMATLLEYAIQYSRFEVPINRSFVGKKNIERLQNAVDHAKEWMDNITAKTYSRPPWEEREIKSRDIYIAYQDLSNELDRIVKMKPYKPKTEEKNDQAKPNEPKKDNFMHKAFSWIKDKIKETAQEASEVDDEEDIVEDNSL